MKTTHAFLLYGLCSCIYAIYKAINIKADMYHNFEPFVPGRFFFFLISGSLALVYSFDELNFTATAARVTGAGMFTAASAGIFLNRVFSGVSERDFFETGINVLWKIVFFILVVLTLIADILFSSMHEW